jgi:hypothetical protein
MAAWTSCWALPLARTSLEEKLPSAVVAGEVVT